MVPGQVASIRLCCETCWILGGVAMSLLPSSAKSCLVLATDSRSVAYEIILDLPLPWIPVSPFNGELSVLTFSSWYVLFAFSPITLESAAGQLVLPEKQRQHTASGKRLYRAKSNNETFGNLGMGGTSEIGCMDSFRISQSPAYSVTE